jgi:hypothetical protein
MTAVKDWFDIVGYVLEAAGVLTILAGALIAESGEYVGPDTVKGGEHA